MRVLIAHNYYQVPGGEDAVARSEAELLKSFGEDVAVYNRDNSELNRMSSLDKTAHLFSLGHSRLSYRQMRDVIRRHRPQVAHFHNIYYMMTPSVYQACHDEGVAVVQSLHNFRMMCSNGLFFRDGRVCEDCLKKNIWEGVKHGCFRGSRVMTLAMASNLDRQWTKGTWAKDVDLYVAAAEFTRSKYIERGIPADKIILKPHFIDPVPKPRTAPGGYALYLGRLSEEKGVGVLLEAWRSLKDYPLKIVGTGPLEAKLRQTARDENMRGVEFTGFVSAQECADYIRSAAVVIIPSLCYENFPRVVVEAFALGVPVIASRLGSLAELVEDGQTGFLFDAGSSSELSAKVRCYFEDVSVSEQMGRKARSVFEAKYSGRMNYEKLMSIYQTAVERFKEKSA